MSVTFWTSVSRSSVDATTAPISLSFWVLAACSEASASSLTRSVTSRAIFEAPTMTPSSLRIGDTVREIAMRVPSLRRRVVS
jgi:hypothetical protein